jgi:REP element-mobilizing transposase RayT
MYGYWLPNDPRGSWSDFVGRWELVQFGRPRRTVLKKSLSELIPQEISTRNAAQRALLYPPVTLSDDQVKSVAAGFADLVRKSGYTVWACAIMPQHAHLVIARHTYKVEQIATLLKGAATRQIVEDRHHPMQHSEANGQLPSMWGRGCWKVYLDNDAAITNAIRYVEQNPIEEEKPKQDWQRVTLYGGLDSGWVTYH